MTYERPGLGRGEVIEHGTTRHGRWLRERRLRVALWIAVIEGILIVVHTIPLSLALVVAVLVVAAYFWGRERLGSYTARQVGWIAAASQAAVAIVPVLLFFASFLALLVLALLAVVALVVLFADRG